MASFSFYASDKDRLAILEAIDQMGDYSFVPDRVYPSSEPEICAITRSIGPPGANCTTTKDTNMIPSKVGIISRMRRTR